MEKSVCCHGAARKICSYILYFFTGGYMCQITDLKPSRASPKPHPVSMAPRTCNKLRLPEAPCQRSDAVSIRWWCSAKLRATSVQGIVVHYEGPRTLPTAFAESTMYCNVMNRSQANLSGVSGLRATVGPRYIICVSG